MPDNSKTEPAHVGMSLRDWFAGQALIGIASRGASPSEVQARFAYDMADAMMAQRAKAPHV